MSDATAADTRARRHVLPRVVRQIVRKDAGHLWPIAVLWLSSLVVTVLAFAAESEILAFAIWPVRTVCLYTLAALVVLEDPLAGRDAFWRTRPISLATLLGSKALFLGLVVFVPAVASEALQMTRIDLPSTRLIEIVGLAALWLAATLTIAAASAASANGFVRFVGFWIGAYALATIASYPLWKIIERRHFLELGDPAPTWMSPATGLLLAAVAIGSATLAILGRTRRLGLARFMVAIPVLYLVVASPRENVVLTSTFATDRSLPPETLNATLESVRARTDLDREIVTATFVVSPDPLPVAVSSVRVEGAIEFSDGDRIPVPSRTLFLQSVQQGDAASLLTTTRPLPPVPVSTVLAALPPADSEEFAGRKGTLEIRVEFGVQRIGVLALPFEKGATAMRQDAGFRIDHAALIDGSPNLRLAITSLRQNAGTWHQNDIFLLNRGLEEIAGFSRSSSGSPLSAGLTIPWPRVFFTEIELACEGPISGHRGRWTSPASGGFQRVEGVLGDDWMGGAELVVVDRRYEGVVTQWFRKEGILLWRDRPPR